MRGGGVGFYVKDGLSFKIINELSPFEEKIFESLSLQVSYPGKPPVLLTIGYRSNGIIVNITQNQQMDRFFAIFEELLLKISQKNLSSYVFLDSDFDLLSLHDAGSASFLNSVISAGFLQCIYKATRMQNNSRTLLDQSKKMVKKLKHLGHFLMKTCTLNEWSMQLNGIMC